MSYVVIVVQRLSGGIGTGSALGPFDSEEEAELVAEIETDSLPGAASGPGFEGAAVVLPMTLPDWARAG